MTSPLFDPVIELAISVAKKGQKAKPKVAAPTKLVPFLSFTNLPAKARDKVIEVVDTDDEFRERLADKVTEAKHGRFAYSYLARPDGWDTYVSSVLEFENEPIIESTSGISKLEAKLEEATAARVEAEESADALRSQLKSATDELDGVKLDCEKLRVEVSELRGEFERLKGERQRAVGELKTTESIMNRHIAARKRLEDTLAKMTSAQVASASVGGAITDAEVRVGLDAIEGTLDDLAEHIETMRRASTPERVAVARRVPLAPPLGLTDDTTEFCEYLLSVPNVVVYVDGYNVTKQAVPELELAEQRSWLERLLTEAATNMSGRFEVIFDGAEVAVRQANTHPQVRIRFSPNEVEADDVIIEAVASADRTGGVVVVSSDKRVRAGAETAGANVLHSDQFVSALR